MWGRGGAPLAGTGAEQLKWALDDLPSLSPRVTQLDADERVTLELVDELRTVLGTAPADVTGFQVQRRVYFWGSWIQHSEYYSTWLFPRLATRDCEVRAAVDG